MSEESSTGGPLARVRSRSWPPAGVVVVALLTGFYGLFFLTAGVVGGLGVIPLVYAAVLFAIAYLTWHRHRWGWWGTMVLYGVGAILAMSNILAGDSRFAVAVVVSLVVLWYLLTHHELFFEVDRA
jgi:hypothetical protein